MQIGLRLQDSEDLALEERLEIVRTQGFSCVHTALSGLTGEAAAAGALTPGYAMYLKRAFDKAQIDIAALDCCPDLACTDKSISGEILRCYQEHIRFASILGCGMVGAGTGAPVTANDRDIEARHSYEALAELIGELRGVVRYAEQMGVILAIEPAYTDVIWNSMRARAVLDAVGSPNLQIIFDPVRLLHGGVLEHRDEVIEEAAELLGRDIAMIRLRDYTVKNGSGKELAYCACGEGEMDFRKVLAFAAEKKPHIHVTLENTKPETAVRAREFIQKLYDSAEVPADTSGDSALKIREVLDGKAPEEPRLIPANVVLTGCDACTFPYEGEAFTVAEIYIRGNEVWMRCSEDDSVIGLDCEYGFFNRMEKDSVILKAPFVIDVTQNRNLMGVVNTLATMFRILSRSMVQDPQEVCARIKDKANENLELRGITMRFTPQHLKFIKNKKFISLEEVVDMISGDDGEIVAEIVE